MIHATPPGVCGVCGGAWLSDVVVAGSVIHETPPGVLGVAGGCSVEAAEAGALGVAAGAGSEIQLTPEGVLGVCGGAAVDVTVCK